MLTLATAVCAFSIHSQLYSPLSSTSCFTRVRSAVPRAIELDDLRQALSRAVAIEDYTEASRLSKLITEASKQVEESEAKKADVKQANRLAADSVDSMIASAGNGIVVMHFTAPEHSMTNSLIERIASKYAASQIVGGTPVAFVQLSELGVDVLGKSTVYVDPRKSGTTPPASKAKDVGLPPGWKQATDPNSGQTYYISPSKETTWTRPLTEAGLAAQKLFKERGVEVLPTTQIWRHAQLLKVVSSMSLEQSLVDLGARPSTGTGARYATGNERLRDLDQGTGLPSATAVDDIDFTGGKAGYGGTAFNTNFNDRGKTTGDYFPDLRDKPGDETGNDGRNSQTDR